LANVSRSICRLMVGSVSCSWVVVGSQLVVKAG